jgi:hypothetical protein
MSDICEMVEVRSFGDSEHEWYEDVLCPRPAVGSHEGVRVCEICAWNLEQEDFDVVYDYVESEFPHDFSYPVVKR